jgi:ABC-type amino acid transport substrate-binding protein
MRAAFPSIGLCALGAMLATGPTLDAAPGATHRTSKDLSAIEQRGTLRALVILDDEREFISGRAGDKPGLDYEILEGFARLQHVKLELVPVESWDGLVPALQQGRGDLIAGRFTITEARKQLIDFTVETFPTRNVVVTRKPHRPVTTLEQLRKERISVVKGTSMAALLPTLGVPAANIDLSVPTGGILVAMRAGRITCTVHEVYTAIVARRDDPAIELGMFVGDALSLAYGVRKTDPQLRAALNAHIDGVRHSPMWSRLVVKYFGESALDVLKDARDE